VCLSSELAITNPPVLKAKKKKDLFHEYKNNNVLGIEIGVDRWMKTK